jgi:hypothetical protein
MYNKVCKFAQFSRSLALLALSTDDSRDCLRHCADFHCNSLERCLRGTWYKASVVL